MIILNHFATSVSWTLFEAVISKVEIFDRAQLTVIGSSPWLELPALMKVLGNPLLMCHYLCFKLVGESLDDLVVVGALSFTNKFILFLLVLATDNQVWRFGRTKCILNPSFSPFQVDDSKLFKGITPPTSFSSWTTTHWKSLSLTDLPFWRSEKKNSTSVPLEFLPLDDFWKKVQLQLICVSPGEVCKALVSPSRH